MIFVVSGFRGSGKSLLGAAAKKMGFEVFEMSAEVLRLMKELGMETTNESVRTFATDFREKGGPDAVAKLLLPKIRRALEEKKKVVVIGARSTHELELFKSLGYVVSVGVISPEYLRFERTRKRGKKSDPATIGDFRWADDVERKWGLEKLMDKCDEKIENDSTEKDFIEKAKHVLSKHDENMPRVRHTF